MRQAWPSMKSKFPIVNLLILEQSISCPLLRVTTRVDFRTMKKYAIVGLTALAVGGAAGVGAYWYWSPYVALNGMRNALRAGDPDLLNAYIDYARVRDSVKGQVSAMVAEKLASVSDSGSEMERVGASLGSMLGLMMVDRLVDAAVRPEALAQAMKSGRFQLKADNRSNDEREHQRKLMAAKVDTATIMQALRLYKLDHGSFPSESQGLKILVAPTSAPEDGRGYLLKLPLDPWGREYLYHSPGVEPGTVDVSHAPPPALEDTPVPAPAEPSWNIERKNADLVLIRVGKDELAAREGPGFVLTREGFAQWKLTEIRLPKM